MSTTQAKKRTLPYAHLLGGLLGHVKAAKGKADDTEPPDEPEDQDQQGTIDNLEDELNAEDETDRIPAGPDDAGAEDDDETDKDEEPAGRRARRAQDEDSEETASARRAGYRAGRAAERARCKAIFKSPAAGARPDLAAYLACDTSMSSASAIAMLQTTVQGNAALTQGSSYARSGLGERMAENPIPKVGAGGAAGGPTLVQQIVAANNRRLGIEPKQ